MSENETVWRSLHDVGLAAWFGGSAFGLAEPVQAQGWKNWTPVLVGAIGAHLIGGAGLVVSNRARIKNQAGVATSTAVKAGLTAVALGLTLQGARDGARLEALRLSRIEDQESAAEVQLERRMRLIGPALPAVTGAMIVLGAIEGEQQRPRRMARGLWDAAVTAVTEHTPLSRVA